MVIIIIITSFFLIFALLTLGRRRLLPLGASDWRRGDRRLGGRGLYIIPLSWLTLSLWKGMRRVREEEAGREERREGEKEGGREGEKKGEREGEGRRRERGRGEKGRGVQ